MECYVFVHRLVDVTYFTYGARIPDFAAWMRKACALNLRLRLRLLDGLAWSISIEEARSADKRHKRC